MTDLHDHAIELLADYRLEEADRVCLRALRAAWEPLLRSNILCTLAHIREARSQRRSARRLYTELLRSMRGKRHGGILRVKAWRGLGRILRVEGDYAAAAPLLRRAVREAGRLKSDPRELAEALGDLGVLYRYTGRLDASSALYHCALQVGIAACGPDDSFIAGVYHMLAGVNHVRGRLEEAEAHGRRSVQVRTAAVGPDHPDTAADAACLAAILIDRGNHDEAKAILEHALKVFRGAYGDEHYEVAVILHNLAAISYGRGRRARAATLFRQSLRIKEKLLGASHPDLVMTLNNLGILESRAGRREEAERLCRRSLRIAERHLSPGHPHLALVRENLEGLTGRD